jgi:hypothetical protein
LERELTAPVEVADAAGRLRREAIGWARHPLLRCPLPAGVSRAHAFNYWCVMDREAALMVLVADVGAAAVALLSFQDHDARAPAAETVWVRPFGLPARLPDDPRGDLAIDARRLRLELRAAGDDLRISGDARTLLGRRLEVDVTVERPRAQETVNVLVAWDDERFHVTSKQPALAARGTVRAGGREHRFSGAFACLDYGRGRWPSRVAWGWAFAAARAGGRTIGFNLGARWTDGTGVTENALVVDGRVHKIADAVDFDPDWRIRARAGGRVDLRFTPRRERVVRVPLGVVSVALRQCVGWFSGTLVDDAGERVAIDDVVGLAETFRGRW